ncbi:acyl-CoA dehydrogenase family protein [Micrococcus endophyticus]|uniref:Alkylation response protein AidB-like acyl-CoA dehydrogenase n=1 Tax=Micrococcus endophyticus TaxID=455343 RepID=A0A7W9JK69_9MICC|nr:acyl-CoA dehydrogenase family protein [Micrococcus endophyticus]MBB5849144.1 alkylation response protein AidB-like acyl-CoA dehydrogenase [Micrococcus endophyticus]
MTSYADLAARFADAFDAVGHGERAREAGRHLPFAVQRGLQEAGFGRVSVPEAAGGDGASHETALRLLMDLAARDVNTAHLWRSHLVFVATVLDQVPAAAKTWLARVVAGDWAGSALAERGTAAPGRAATMAERDEGGTWVVTGEKYYATGSAFATWTIATVGVDGDALVSRRNSKRAGGVVREPGRAVAVVRVRQPRVRVKDDWDGFGQRLTATGSVVLDGAAAEALLEVPRREGPVPVLQEASLLALQVGVGRAALAEGVELLRARRRTFNTGTEALPAQDPQLLEIMGRLSGQLAAAEALMRQVGGLMDEAEAQGAAGDDDGAARLMEEAMVAAYRAQAVVPDAVLGVCTGIFDTLGASATSASLQLDRHWRNARTLATHDPAAFKVRMAGDHLVNGTPPTAYTSAGVVDDD